MLTLNSWNTTEAPSPVPIDVTALRRPLEDNPKSLYQKIIDEIERPYAVESLDLTTAPVRHLSSLYLYGYKREEIDNMVNLVEFGVTPTAVIEVWTSDLARWDIDDKHTYVQNCLGLLLWTRGDLSLLKNVISAYNTDLMQTLSPAKLTWTCALFELMSYKYQSTEFDVNLQLAKSKVSKFPVEKILEPFSLKPRVLGAAGLRILSLSEANQAENYTHDLLLEITQALGEYKESNLDSYLELLYATKILLAERITIDEKSGELLFEMKKPEQKHKISEPPIEKQYTNA